MCTAISFKTRDRYFGRTLDNDCSYGEQVTLTPRNYPLTLRNGSTVTQHRAIIGMAHTANGYPLYYDAVNESGLCIAALRFPLSAHYSEYSEQIKSMPSFEVIPRLLCCCDTLDEACRILQDTAIDSTAFSPALPPSPLHWLIADSSGSAVLEAVNEGVRLYPDHVGVLTNEPPFPEQLSRLNNYINLSAEPPKDRFAKDYQLTQYSLGMGAIGLPGDLSSPSRFARAAFFKLNSVSEEGEKESVGQFFHIMDTVAQPLGGCSLGNGHYENTLYTSCCNANKGIYYYTSYQNRQITAIDMHREELDGSELIHFPLQTDEQIKFEN